jgi:hypothetical protein
MNNDHIKDSSSMRAVPVSLKRVKYSLDEDPKLLQHDHQWRQLLAPGKRKKSHSKTEFQSRSDQETGSMSELFFRIATLAENHGITRHSVQRGCWEVTINREWTLSLNLQETEQRNRIGMEIPPLAAYIERAGFPVGLVWVTGGELMVGAQNDLLKALRDVTSVVHGDKG